MICSQCQSANRPQAKFCARCGHFLQQQADQTGNRPPPLPAYSAPPSPVKAMLPTPTSHRAKWLVGGGMLAISCLLLVLVWAFFLRPTVDETSLFVKEDASSVTITLATATPFSAVILDGDEETAVVPPGATPIPPTPTFGSLQIPGTDIVIPRIDDEEEIAIGQSVAQQIEAEFTIYSSPQALSRVSHIGQAIVPVSDRPHLPYTFTLLDTDQINAFAVPGGFIYVTRGMLDFVQNDDELAAVIGHEVAHIARRHGAQKLETLALAEAAVMLLLQAEPDLEQIYETQEGRLGAEMATTLLLSGWSRQDEFEADEYGTIYMAQAGYDPQAIIVLFERMEAAFTTSQHDEIAQLFATHPPFPERIRHIEQIIAREGL